MIDDDRLVMETKEKWVVSLHSEHSFCVSVLSLCGAFCFAQFGPDNSGDICRAHNIRALWDEVMRLAAPDMAECF